MSKVCTATAKSVQHIWLKEVCYGNPLTANTIHRQTELVHRGKLYIIFINFLSQKKIIKWRTFFVMCKVNGVWMVSWGGWLLFSFAGLI